MSSFLNYPLNINYPYFYLNIYFLIIIYMNSKIILPMEIVNKILIMRPPHPMTNIIKPLTLSYNEYTNNDDYITFFEYIMKYYDLHYNYNIKCYKKYDDERLRCYGCGYYFKRGDLYFSNSHTINCRECF